VVDGLGGGDRLGISGASVVPQRRKGHCEKDPNGFNGTGVALPTREPARWQFPCKKIRA
jgi:hypothetical protein